MEYHSSLKVLREYKVYKSINNAGGGLYSDAMKCKFIFHNQTCD